MFFQGFRRKLIFIWSEFFFLQKFKTLDFALQIKLLIFWNFILLEFLCCSCLLLRILLRNLVPNFLLHLQICLESPVQLSSLISNFAVQKNRSIKTKILVCFEYYNHRKVLVSAHSEAVSQAPKRSSTKFCAVFPVWSKVFKLSRNLSKTLWAWELKLFASFINWETNARSEFILFASLFEAKRWRIHVLNRLRACALQIQNKKQLTKSEKKWQNENDLILKKI